MRPIHVLIGVFLLFSSLAGAQSTESPTADTLLVGIKESPPFVYLGENDRPTGISVWLWEQLAEDIGVAYRYEWMNLEPLLDSLAAGRVDLSINPLTVTSERIERLDFTQPFFVSNSAVATRKDGGMGEWLGFLLQFFSLNFLKAVLLLFAVIFVFGFIAWLFERRHNPEEFEPGWKGLWSGIWWSAVTMTTVGYGDKSPQSTGGRVVALVWMFTAIIIISGFTAGIASSLTVNQLSSDINSLESLRERKVGTVAASASETFLDNQYIRSKPYPTLREGLEALQDGTLKAFAYDEPILRYAILQDSAVTLQVLPFRFNKQYYSFALPRESPWLDRLNPVLLRRVESSAWRVVLSEYDLHEL